MDVVQEVRRFNRFYTHLVGLLDEHLPDSGLSLPEGRVLYELATGGKQTAADLTRTLGIDKAQLSRVIRALSNRKLLTSEADPAHGKKRLLSLTPAGRVAFSALDQGTRLRMESVLGPLSGVTRKKLVSSMREIQAAFDVRDRKPASVILRPPVPGDLGWVIHRQAVLYAQEYGWDNTYEALISKILGEYAIAPDASREDAWIAERDGQIVGSIFLMKSEDPDAAKLRLLYVEPSARGLGLGRRLVDTCIQRARQLGYRRVTLWTNDVLVAARRIYETSGFRLTGQSAHRSFGRELVGQTWDLDLHAHHEHVADIAGGQA
jgi:DNA-binding MarR family transcriptional regulator/GNAT superfamily N-acetyltransferase